jgi:5'-3' exonuclease
MIDESLIIDKMNYILIDMSYFIFYRFYALVNWWGFARKEDPLDMDNILENEELLKKFEDVFIKKIKEIPKKLKLKEYVFLVAKDCPRKDIWRRAIFPDYKENRIYEDTCAVSKFFEIAYQILNRENYHILFHPQLEADDCIATVTKYILKNNNECKIYIIASDMDYLQLGVTNVNIINLKYKNLMKGVKSSGNPKKDLFCKIVMGDKSDNIPGIFKRCGLKTAIKYYDDEDYFNKILKKENAYQQFERNKKLIDFENIPMELSKTLFK